MSENQPGTPANEGEATNQPADEAPQGPQSIDEAIAKIAELEKDVTKFKTLARKEEDAKKKNWDELQALKTANMSETDKAIHEAEQRGRAAAMAEYDSQIKRTKLEAAATSAGVPSEVLDLLDPSKLFTDTGDPNVELLSSLAGKQRRFDTTATDLNIGAQSNGNAGQLTHADLKGMSPQEIMQARKDGRLNALMQGRIR